MPATIVLSAYPGRCTQGGRELALSIGVAVPQRRVEVTDLSGVIGAVASFERDVQAANPAASSKSQRGSWLAGSRAASTRPIKSTPSAGGSSSVPTSNSPHFTVASSIPPPQSMAPGPRS